MGKKLNLSVYAVREYAKTHSIGQCAEEFNCSYGFMWNFIFDNHIEHRRGTWKHRNETRDLQIYEAAKTHTYKEVGNMFGMTRQRVAQIVISVLQAEVGNRGSKSKGLCV